ncbi:MAG: orotidine-5'-phosphate decarboxylase [Chloroflexi bacterium]|nr:MAG: orotidine-5'-phosphate decarboxylase [Chloroflexota bacterium]
MFLEKLVAAQRQNRSWLCVGLDPVGDRLPPSVRRQEAPLFAFLKAIVDATADLVCAYKPNLGFFLAEGTAGMEALRRIIRYIPDPIPVILDGKFGDIAHTAAAYARGAFERLGADAVTISPYVGSEAVRPFLAYPDRAVFVLARTSNPGAGEFQDLAGSPAGEDASPVPLFLQVARQAVRWAAEGPGTCGLVVGATHPADLARLRQTAPTLPFLIPGVGAQGGDLEATVRFGPTHEGIGPIVNVSRAVLYASTGEDFAQAARTTAERLRATIASLLGPA